MNDQQKRDLVLYQISKAKETLNEIEVHLKNEFWNTAVNRLYYACFYAVTALLIDKELYSKTHSGTKQLFGLHFIRPGIITEVSGDYYTEIFELRQTGDYQSFFIFDKEEVLALLQPARNLIAEIEQILSEV